MKRFEFVVYTEKRSQVWVDAETREEARDTLQRHLTGGEPGFGVTLLDEWVDDITTEFCCEIENNT